MKNRDKLLDHELIETMKTRPHPGPLMIAVLFALGSAAFAAPAPTVPLAKGASIFACHHSFFVPVPAILTELANAGGFPDQNIIGTHMIGSSKSIQHWNIPDAENKAKQELLAGKVDVLVLTPGYLPDEGIGKFAQFGFEHNPNFRVTVMEAWAPFDVYNPVLFDPHYKPQPDEPPVTLKPVKVDHNAATADGMRKMMEYYVRTMNEHVIAVNKKLGKPVVFVVPMTQAVVALREKIIAGQAPGLKVQEDLFSDQLGHPKPPLAVLEAYCHYAVIYRKSPVGLPVPSALASSGIPAEEIEPLNRLLQELAWDAVIHHPLSGVVAQ